MARQINAAGLELIKSFEGLKLSTYQDSVGVWTIGYGSTKGVKRGQRITEEEAEELLHKDLAEAQGAVENAVTVELNDNQFAALVSFTFNLGAGTLRKSRLLQRLNVGRFSDAADQILLFDHAGRKRLAGLTRRRKAERELFLTPDSNEPVAVDEPAESATVASSTVVTEKTTELPTDGGTTTTLKKTIETVTGNEQVKVIASEGVSKLATRAVASITAAGTGATAGAATSHNPWPWIILAIVCLLFVGGIVWFWMWHRSSKEKEAARINSDKSRTDIVFSKPKEG